MCEKGIVVKAWRLSTRRVNRVPKVQREAKQSIRNPFVEIIEPIFRRIPKSEWKSTVRCVCERMEARHCCATTAAIFKTDVTPNVTSYFRLRDRHAKTIFARSDTFTQRSRLCGAVIGKIYGLRALKTMFLSFSPSRTLEIVRRLRREARAGCQIRLFLRRERNASGERNGQR